MSLVVESIDAWMFFRKWHYYCVYGTAFYKDGKEVKPFDFFKLLADAKEIRNVGGMNMSDETFKTMDSILHRREIITRTRGGGPLPLPC